MTTITLTPKSAFYTSITVNGRTYSCAFGSSINVPDFDAEIMAANGWDVVPQLAVNVENGGGSGAVNFTDGTHTVSAGTKLTVSGGTIGGANPNATLTIPASATPTQGAKADAAIADIATYGDVVTHNASEFASSSFPQGSHSANYTTTSADANSQQLHPFTDDNARTFTIDSNANAPCPISSAIVFVNEANVLTIDITDDTMTLAGGTLTGPRTLAAYGIATAFKTGATRWIISGTNLT